MAKKPGLSRRIVEPKELRYGPKSAMEDILSDWKSRTRKICKPCWELKYCPYGPLVEQYPLSVTMRTAAVDHKEYIASCIEAGESADGAKLTRNRRRLLERWLQDFNPNDYPETVPELFLDASCRVFGHMCPVFFAAEDATETKDYRVQSRVVPRKVMLKVVRRDGQICQKCHKAVPDNEVEFDHIIPFARGGPTTAENLRLVHRNCNRTKGASLVELLA